MPPLRRQSRVPRWQTVVVVVVSIIVSQTLSIWLAHSIFSHMPVWWEIGLTGVLILMIAATIMSGMTISPSLTAAQSVQAATELIISKVPEGIILIDAKGVIQHMNAAAEAVFGGQLHQYQGRKVSDLIPALDFAFINSVTDANSREFSGRKTTGEDFPVAVSIVKNTGRDSRSSWVMIRDISEDKRRQHELVESSEQLHAIFSNMKIMLALMDDKFNFLRVNDTYAAPSGHPPSYFVGKNHFALYPDAENENIFKEVVRSGKPFVIFAKPFAHPDIPGEMTYWDWSVHPIKDETGRVTEVLMAVIDATERQKLTDYQVLSEEKFRTVFDNVGDAVLIHDMFKNFTEVNAVACERLGYSKQELLELSPKDISEAATPEQFTEAISTLMENKHLLMETVHVAKDGRRIPVEINARLVQFDGKSAVLTVARDISERKRAEAARIASEQNMRALFNGAHDAVCLMKPDGTILEANQTFAKRLLTTPSELIGRDVFTLIPSDVAVARKKKIQEMMIRKESMSFEDVRAGHIIDNSLYPILGENGEVDRIAVYSRDITQKRLDEQIEAMLHSIDSQILGGNLIEEILQYTCENISRLFGVPLSFVAKKLTDGGTTILAHAGTAVGYVEDVRQIGLRWDDSTMAGGPMGRTIRSGSIQRVEIEHPGYAPWRASAEKNGIGSVMALPLVMQGEVFGALGIFASSKEVFEDADNYRRFLQIASRLNVAIGIAQDHDRLRLLGTALSAANTAVFIADTEGRIIWVNPAFENLTGYGPKEAIGSTPRILNSGKQDADYYKTLWDTILAGHVWTSDVIERHRNGTLFPVRQKVTPIRGAGGKVTHFIAIMEDISAQKMAEKSLEMMAYYDALTELPNRKLFMDRLSQNIRYAQRHEETFALLFVDLDGFKVINDTFGHDIGDELLKAVSRAMQGVVRESDTVARQAGDEFIVMLPRIARDEVVIDIADKLLTAVGQTFTFKDKDVRVGASIGIAYYPRHGEDAETLVRHADAAMYVSKSKGRNCYSVYEGK